MTDDLRRALAEELKPAGGPDAPEPHRSVQIDLDDLARLVRRAVDDSYSAHSGGRGVLAWEAEARLATLLDGFERSERLRRRLEEQRRALQEELSRVRGELVARRGFAEGLERTAAWPVDAERWHTLRLRAQSRLLSVLPAHQRGGPSARTVAADLLELFAKERAVSLAEVSRRTDSEVARLERRLTQLVATLEEADEVLAALRELPHVETGLASGYRGVQGLDAEARQRELKSAVLARLFRANVELQQGARPDGSGGAHALTG